MCNLKLTEYISDEVSAQNISQTSAIIFSVGGKVLIGHTKKYKLHLLRRINETPIHTKIVPEIGAV